MKVGEFIEHELKICHEYFTSPVENGPIDM